MEKINWKYWFLSLINSYSQLFFSLDKVLGLIIMLVTFFDPYLGLCGLAAVLLTNLFALVFGLNKESIEKGIYGFNAVLLGLALGFEYRFGLAFGVVFISSLFLLLFLTVSLSTWLGKKQLPFLGLPFLFTYWFVYLSVSSFSLIQLQEQLIYVENYVANASESYIYIFAHYLDGAQIPFLLKSYFKTLSATFFQNSVLAGMAISLGLLYFSRMAFSLSLLGFFTAYYLFQLLGVPVSFLTDYLIGSNFIFMAIAIGGFYLVPSKGSYISVLFLVPILSIFLISIEKIMMIFQLKSFTLSFSLVSILFLFFVQNRYVQKFIKRVSIYYYSAEKTIYKHVSASQRFKYAHLAKITLPFWGYWKVSQGYKGSITHIGEWGEALDFVITDDYDKTYADPGIKREDYFCYNKPVVAPYDAYVYDIVDYIDDNKINEVNTEKNWGNTIILNHQNGLFSQLSHLKKDSVKVKIGDYVKRGDILASCGNSGRSPEPHLHFQLQLSPKIGEKTYRYPIAYYIKNDNGKQKLKTFEIPQENDVICNIQVDTTLVSAYDLQPGRTLRMRNKKNQKDIYEWKVYIDTWNRTYLNCSKTNSKLWFVNDGISFYCYDFEGDKDSLLFYFYLANYKIILGVYPKIRMHDIFPLNTLGYKPLQYLQDLFAPFYRFINVSYKSQLALTDNTVSNKDFIINTKVTSKAFRKTLKEVDFAIHIKEGKIQTFITEQSNKIKIYLCELY